MASIEQVIAPFPKWIFWDKNEQIRSALVLVVGRSSWMAVSKIAGTFFI